MTQSLRSADERKLVHKRKCMELKLFLPGSPGGSKKKKKKFNNYPQFGNDANFENYPDASDVIIRYNRSCKITSPKYNLLQLLPCLDRQPFAFTSMCGT